uniref:Uncharacterized protein n=1 Tax=Trichinella nativa TaxID=6335 RepID=A0A0V1KIY6_9BILA
MYDLKVDLLVLDNQLDLKLHGMFFKYIGFL